MLLRFFCFLLVVFYCISCTNFPWNKKQNLEELDTIINFNSVDASPFFKECKDFIDDEKTACFRKTIHQKIVKRLRKITLEAKDSINEIVIADLLISSKGIITLKSLNISDKTKKKIPQLDSLITSSVNNLPNIYPANKRGIPVATQYSLPIKIELK